MSDGKDDPSKPKTLLLSIFFSDSSHKKIAVAPNLTVQQLIEFFAEKIELVDSYYFAFAEVNADGVDRWLDNDGTLESQSVTSSCKLTFKIKYWKHVKNLSDPVAIHLFFIQVHSNICNGIFTCGEAQAVRLAGYQMQALHGDFNPNVHKSGFLDSSSLQHYLPAEHRPPAKCSPDFIKHYQQRLYTLHATFSGMPKPEAKMRYIEITEQLPTYGISFFKASRENGQALYLGIAEDGLFIFTFPTKEYTEFFPFSQCRGWQGVQNSGSAQYKGVLIKRTAEHPQQSLDDDDDDDELQKVKEDSLVFNLSHQASVTVLELLTGYCSLLATSGPKYRWLTKILPDSQPSSLPPSSLFHAPRKRMFGKRAASALELFKQLYFTLCIQLVVSPSLKLCSQVDQAMDTNAWLESIVILKYLSGASFDDKAVEVLATSLAKSKQSGDEPRDSFFNNLAVVSLDLSSNCFDAEKSSSSLQLLLTSGVVKSFNLSGNKLGNKGCLILAPRFAVCKTLEIVDLSSNDISEKGIESLLKEDIQLSTLILNNNKVGEKGCMLIADFLIKNTLTQLDLNNNKIGDAGVEHITRGLKGCKSLVALDLVSNSFGTKGGIALANALMYSKSLKRLQLGNNKLTSEVGKAFGEAIKVNYTVTSLDFRNNLFGKVGCLSIAAGLKLNTQLLDLNLDQNQIDPSGASSIGSALITNTSLTSLSLNNNVLAKADPGIGTGGLDGLTELLTKSTVLLNLDLGNNALLPKSILEVSEGLGDNQTLIYLNLDGNKVGEEGCVSLAKALNYNESLITLHLDNASLTDNAVGHLCSMLDTNQSLKVLSLRNNALTDRGVMCILDALATRKSDQVLSKVDCSNNKILDKSAVFAKKNSLNLELTIVL